MVYYRLNALRGFTPVAVAPPNAINPEQVIRHHRSAQGRYGGTGNVPSFIISVLRISYHSKNISTEVIFNQNKRRFYLFAQYPVNSVHRFLCRTHAKDHDCCYYCDICRHTLIVWMYETVDQQSRCLSSRVLIPEFH